MTGGYSTAGTILFALRMVSMVAIYRAGENCRTEFRTTERRSALKEILLIGPVLLIRSCVNQLSLARRLFP
jgi:hypothetical protein